MCKLGGTRAAFQSPAFSDGWGKVRFKNPKQMDNECTSSAPISVLGVCLSGFTDGNVIWSSEQLALHRRNSRFRSIKSLPPSTGLASGKAETWAQISFRTPCAAPSPRQSVISLLPSHTSRVRAATEDASSGKMALRLGFLFHFFSHFCFYETFP